MGLGKNSASVELERGYRGGWGMYGDWIENLPGSLTSGLKETRTGVTSNKVMSSGLVRAVRFEDSRFAAGGLAKISMPPGSATGPDDRGATNNTNNYNNNNTDPPPKA